MGTRTFGKGTVQVLLDLRQGKLKLTSAKFYRISGKSTQHKGIVPDIIFPAIYDAEEIGESALEEALPWDQIRPANYRARTDYARLLPVLRVRHETRVKASPDFSFLRANMNRLKEIREKTTYSLREATRKEEQERSDRLRLDLENKRRVAKGLKPLERIDDLKGGDKGKKGNSLDDDKPDPFLEEAEAILLDVITISKEALAKH